MSKQKRNSRKKLYKTILLVCSIITASGVLVNIFWKNNSNIEGRPNHSVEQDEKPPVAEPEKFQIEKEIISYDTIQLFIPSKLKIKQILLDGKTVNTLKKLPTILILAIEQKSTNQKLSVHCQTHLCELNLNFTNNKKYSITLRENCQLINYEK